MMTLLKIESLEADNASEINSRIIDQRDLEIIVLLQFLEQTDKSKYFEEKKSSKEPEQNTSSSKFGIHRREGFKMR